MRFDGTEGGKERDTKWINKVHIERERQREIIYKNI